MDRRGFLKVIIAAPCMLAAPRLLAAPMSVAVDETVAVPIEVVATVQTDSINYLDRLASIYAVHRRHEGESDDSLRRRMFNEITHKYG